MTDINVNGNDQTQITGEQLRAFIERIESLAEEKTAVQEQIKEVMQEAKSSGFDTRVIRKIISIRKRDRDDLAEEEAILEVYMEALEML